MTQLKRFIRNPYVTTPETFIEKEGKGNRPLCPICGERLKAGEKAIWFISGKFQYWLNSRKAHMVCWLSELEQFPTAKEIREAKKLKLLRSI
jgi:hypothetical protein